MVYCWTVRLRSLLDRFTVGPFTLFTEGSFASLIEGPTNLSGALRRSLNEVVSQHHRCGLSTKWSKLESAAFHMMLSIGILATELLVEKSSITCATLLEKALELSCHLWIEDIARLLKRCKRICI